MAILAAGAGLAEGISLPEVAFADGERAGVGEFSRADESRNWFLRLDAVCRNVATNAFEIQFSAQERVSAENIAFAFGFENGKWWSHGGDVADRVVYDEFPLPSGAFALKIDGEFYDSRTILVASVGGFSSPALRDAMLTANPKLWRGVRVFSRGLDGEMQDVEIDSGNYGLAISIR
ncbi:MAG: hypothetical protein IJ802_00625 [Kiritimatiellae bacterium]|nr:hypothetical protein [Kiritimatiellia bacterium]